MIEEVTEVAEVVEVAEVAEAEEKEEEIIYMRILKIGSNLQKLLHLYNSFQHQV